MGIFPMPVRPTPDALLRALVARGETLAGLERLLSLSTGYLSKVNRQRVVPSPQLVSLLQLLVQHPEVRRTLARPQEASAGKPAKRSPPGRASSQPTAFLQELQKVWRTQSVRFVAVDDLLLRSLKVRCQVGLEPSLRFLVHPRDRHALAAARELGASISLANSWASVCTPRGCEASIVFVFPLQPLWHLLQKPKVTPTDAALYFALQHGSDAEARLRATAKAYALPSRQLLSTFGRIYGGAPPIPAKEWLARSMFDPVLARDRIANLP